MFWMAKMKEKWGVGPIGVVLIIVVFGLTGSTVVWLKKPILAAVMPPDASGWQKWGLYLLVIFPLYQALLLAYGTIFGQFRFFWAKEKAMVRGVGRLFGRRS